MKCKHTTPCNECPWRKNSMQGYLGGHPVEMYADAVAENEVTACHLQDFGPDDDQTAMCAGALAVMANACILPDDNKSPGAREARERVGRRDDVFDHPSFFYSYHTQREWVPRFFRKRAS